MNIPSAIILILLAAWFVWALRHTRRHGICPGCGSCGKGCRHCSSALKIAPAGSPFPAKGNEVVAPPDGRVSRGRQTIR
ncbi:MAG: hypothetical protein J6Z49_04415 [Kiritimatiellae bacterium]|nr:hypothetical protein [Kiritimatiellia bacterium]